MVERPWTDEHEERLRELVAQVEAALESGMEPEQVARAVVPTFAGHSSITSLAEAMGVDRGNLSTLLGGTDPRPFRAIRVTLDRFLKLPPGGMERVLALVEFHAYLDATD